MNGLALSGTALAATGAAAAIGSIARTIAAPTSTFWGPVRSRADNGGFALTFDDGPSRDSTAATLDILARLGATATFFVIGVNARRCPDLLLRMRDEGHLIANHSMHHSHFGMFGLTRYWERELSDTDRIIEDVIGARPTFFRPPMGIKTPWLMRAAGRRHQVITWTRRAVDGVSTTPQLILRRLVPGTQGGDILLLHDGVEPSSRRDPSASLAAIEPLIHQLRDRGLAPVPLDQLLRTPGYEGVTSSGREIK